MLGWERIVRLTVAKRMKYHVYLEIIPRGFLVVTSYEDKILYADRFASMKDRSIKPGEQYTPPPGRYDLLNMSSDELVKALWKGKDLVRGIVKGWGLPGYLAEEILHRAGLYHLKNIEVNGIEQSDLVAIVESLHRLINESLSGIGYLVIAGKRPIFVSPYKPTLLIEQNENYELKTFNEFNDALDYYFGSYEKIAIEEKKSIEEQALINRLEKSLREQDEIIHKYEEELHNLKQILNTIYTNHAYIEKTLECTRNVREKYGWERITSLCKGAVDIDKKHGRVIIEVNGVRIPLDIRLDLWRNVLEIKKRIGELSSKIRRAIESKEKILEEIERLRESLELGVLKASTKIKPRAWYEKYHWLITSHGYLVIGGRDAGQNETIVRKYLEHRDIFLHADIHGGPATVMKTRGTTPPLGDVEEAAHIAGCYSRAWNAGLGYIDVYWVHGDQVSKTPPSGEYLARGAFMVYGKKNYVRIENKLAIGIEQVCDPIYGAYQRIITGPIELISQRSLIYAVIIPGDERPSELSRKLFKTFRKKLEPKHIVGVEVGEIEYRIPGLSRIISVDIGMRYGEKCIL